MINSWLEAKFGDRCGMAFVLCLFLSGAAFIVAILVKVVILVPPQNWPIILTISGVLISYGLVSWLVPRKVKKKSDYDDCV